MSILKPSEIKKLRKELKKGFPKKSLKKTGYKLSYEIYFLPKKRDEIKKDVIKLKDSLEKCWHSSKEELEKSGYDRETLIKSAAFCAKFLKWTKQAEKWKAGLRLKNKKYKVHRHISTSSTIVEFNFFKISEGKQKTNYWLIRSGLPKNKEKKKLTWYKSKVSKKNYNLIDSGTFFQKINDFSYCFYLFRNKKSSARYKLKNADKNPKYPKKFYISISEQ